MTWPWWRLRRCPQTSTPVTRPALAAIATASTAGASDRRSRFAGAGGIRAGSTSTRSPPPPTCCWASTTSAPSRPPRPSTTSSCGVFSTPPGTSAANTSTSRSPPTRSCGTWCARSSARCSTGGRRRSLACSTVGRGRTPAPTAPPWGLYLVAVELLTAEYDQGVRFPVCLFDLDGTLIDSGPMIVASMKHAAQDRARAATSRKPC